MDDLTQVAVGFANGSVTIIRGDFIHDRGTKQRTVFESEDPVTGLEVRQGATKVLYISTIARISSLVISGKGQGQPVRTVDNRGCDIGCMTFDTTTNDIIVAREDAIYYYGPNGRGPSYAFDGPKKLVKLYKEYVGLVCPPRVAQLSKTKTFRRLGADEVDDIFSSSSFTLLDTDLRYVACNELLPAPPKEVFVNWGELFLLTEDGKVSSSFHESGGYLTFAAVPIPGKVITTEARYPLSAESLHLSYQSCPKIWGRHCAPEHDLPQIW